MRPLLSSLFLPLKALSPRGKLELPMGPALDQGSSAIQILFQTVAKTRPRTPEAGMAESLTNTVKTIGKKKKVQDRNPTCVLLLFQA